MNPLLILEWQKIGKLNKYLLKRSQTAPLMYSGPHLTKYKLGPSWEARV